MLKNIRFNNFYSVGSEQELSFEVGSKDVHDHSTRPVNGTNINLVSCIIGHNASGKTTILKAITYLLWFIKNSYSRKQNEGTDFNQHKLYSSEYTNIEIEFFNDETLYKYKISLNEDIIFSEKLSIKNARRFIRLFEYERNGVDWDFKVNSDIKINKADKERFKKRKNVSVLSSLIDTGYLSEIKFFENYTTNVSSAGLMPRNNILPLRLFETLHTDKKLQARVLSLLKEIDLGISGFEFSEVTVRDQEKPKEEEIKPFLYLKHGDNDKNFDLPFYEESDGTCQSLSIFTKILPALEFGKIVILDEIEDGLHPYVVKKIISLFENTKTNPRGAQLFFSTHQHLLLNDRTKTQIFLAERELETEIYRLDEVGGVRNDENYFHKYIAGTYGGIPHIDWL